MTLAQDWLPRSLTRQLLLTTWPTCSTRTWLWNRHTCTRLNVRTVAAHALQAAMRAPRSEEARRLAIAYAVFACIYETARARGAQARFLNAILHVTPMEREPGVRTLATISYPFREAASTVATAEM